MIKLNRVRGILHVGNPDSKLIAPWLEAGYRCFCVTKDWTWEDYIWRDAERLSEKVSHINSVAPLNLQCCFCDCDDHAETKKAVSLFRASGVPYLVHVPLGGPDYILNEQESYRCHSWNEYCLRADDPVKESVVSRFQTVSGAGFKLPDPLWARTILAIPQDGQTGVSTGFARATFLLNRRRWF